MMYSMSMVDVVYVTLSVINHRSYYFIGFLRNLCFLYCLNIKARMSRTFKLTKSPPQGDLVSSDAISMDGFIDGHWVDRQLLHDTLGNGLPQTSLQPLPGHIPANAELSLSQEQQRRQGYDVSDRDLMRYSRLRRHTTEGFAITTDAGGLTKAAFIAIIVLLLIDLILLVVILVR